MIRNAALAAVMFGAALGGGYACAETSGPGKSAKSATPTPHAAVPRAVTVARATEIPRCTSFVDAAAAGTGAGTAQNPHQTIAAAVAAAQPGAVICVAEGTYAEQLTPGEKHLTLAGGFQRGANFKVRDSAVYLTRVTGKGGSFIRYDDPAPKGDQLTAIDGFDISGYAQAIFRDIYYSQRFDITNNYIHDNRCANNLAGAAFALNNVSGRIAGNVIRNNACGRGGAGFVNDDSNSNTVTIEGNLIDGNAGTEPEASHGGGLYLFGKNLRIIANLFVHNRVTRWGGGLYIGAYTEGGQHTSAMLNWNVYRDNRAGTTGGGMFCDEGAHCTSYHEIYDRNCGGNILLDGGTTGSGPTVSRFGHLTNLNALDAACKAPGVGVRIDKENDAPDNHAFVDALFWGNAQDFAGWCGQGCKALRVNVSYSMAQTRADTDGYTINFGAGMVTPADPEFAAPDKGDFHLKSKAGRWTPTGYVNDPVSSPALAKGFPSGATNENPARAGKRNELGAYGNSSEASYTR